MDEVELRIMKERSVFGLMIYIMSSSTKMSKVTFYFSSSFQTGIPKDLLGCKPF